MSLTKRITSFIVFLFLLTSVEAQISPICVQEKFANQKTNNQQWNNLLDKACTEMNQKKYGDALKSLDDAMKIDSIDSKGEYSPNAYIDVIQRRIRRYLTEASQPTAEQASEPISSTKLIENKAIVANPTPEKVAEKTNTTPNSNDLTKNVAIETPKTTFNEKKIEPTTEVEKKIEPTGKEVTTAETLPKKEDSFEKTQDSELKALTDVAHEVKSEPKKEKGELKFNEKDKQDFQAKGMQKVKQLESFVGQIGSKNTATSMKTQSITSALKLFDSEEKTVQVSSNINPDKKKYKIRSYLTKLSLLNYSDVKIEWADFQYASDFIKGLDGNYYGYIVFQQRFSATSLDNQQVYSDVTTKKIEIILKVYEKAEQGQLKEQWDVFLGDISVVQTEGN